MVELTDSRVSHPAVDHAGDLARAWHLMRWLAAALVAVLFLLYEAPPARPLPIDQTVAAALFSAALVAANLVSLWIARRSRLGQAALIALLAWDTVTVLGIEVLFAFDTRSSIWAILIFPILGAAALWQLRGALWGWFFVTVLYGMLRIVVDARGGPEFILSSLVFRASLLLLVGLFVGSLQKELSALIDALRAAQAQLRERATHDDLTGLANRADLRQRLSGAVARAERGGPAPALLFLDCDDFKVINDELGHSAGDAALITIAKRLQGEIRAGDVAARLGGDEFCVLLQTQETVASAERLAGRLRQRLREPWRQEAFTIEISVSIGVAVWSPGTTAAGMLHRADQAMYRNKQDSHQTVIIR